MICALFVARAAVGQVGFEEQPVVDVQPAAARSPLDAAREHMERGQALYQAERYVESVEEFLRAYDAQPFSAFLYNAGVACEKLGQAERAADFFERFLASERTPPSGAEKLRARIDRLRGLARARDAQKEAAHATSASLQQAARQALARETEQLEALGGAAAFKSLLSVQTTPADAIVSIKRATGEVVKQSYGQHGADAVDPGSYVVEVMHAKYKTIATPITIAAGKVYVVIVELSQGQFLGLLRVESNVPGAQVYLDRREAGALGRTPYQSAVTTGKHALWIERPGYEPVAREVEVGVGDDVLVRVDLARVAFGRVRLVANRADAEVRIDGRPIGRVPLEVDVPHGAHEVVVSAPGMKDYRERVMVQRGQATPLRVRLRPEVSRAGAWVTAGIAGGVLAGSVGAAIAGRRMERGLDDDRAARTLESDDDRVARAKWLYVGADVGFGVTAALAGLAAWYFLRDPLPNSEGRVLVPRDWAFDPRIGQGKVAGNLRVRF
ncbi:MAG: PEGA domain-containing protein [Polyangiales bacterium]